MDNEALNHAYDLFSNDGYSGTVEDFSKLLNTNEEAVDYAYSLFKNDGYKNTIGDFKNLVIPIQETVEEVKTTEEVETTEELEAAKSTENKSSTDSGELQDNTLTDTIMGTSYQVSEEGIASGKKNREAARNFFSTKKSKLEQALDNVNIEVPLTKKDIASVDTDLQLAQSPKIKELEARLKEVPSMSQEAADILKEIESIKSATTESRVNPRNKSYQKNINVVTQHEDKVAEITNRVVSSGGDENEVKKQVDFYEKNNPEQTRINTANYEVETINRALDNISTARTGDTYSSFSDTEEEATELTDLVEQQIIEDLSIKDMGKAAENNYTLSEKENIIRGAKHKVVQSEYKKAEEVYNSAVVVDFVEKKNNLDAQIKAMSRYDDDGLLLPFSTEEEANKYNDLVGQYNDLDVEREKVNDLVLSAKNRLETTFTELGFNAVDGTISNNFEMTDEYQEWRNKHVKERGFWGGTYDAVGTFVQEGVNIAADATVGTSVWLAGLMDETVNKESRYYNGHDVIQDSYKNFANFNWAGTSDYGADILDEDGNYTINARSTTKTIANMLPFTIGVILSARSGNLKPAKNLWNTVGPKFLTSPKGKSTIRMVDASYRMTVNDNFHEGKNLGLDDSQSYAYSGMKSFGTGLSQMIMPDANFLGSTAGKTILKGFVSNLKNATTKKAIGGATKQFVVNMGKELGEEELELAFGDIAKYSVGLAHSPDILDLRTQKETIAATLMLSGSLGSIGTVNDIKNAKKQVYQQYKDNGQDIIDVLDDNLKVANTKFENARTQKSKDNHQATIDQINDAKNYGQSIINAINIAPENVSDDQIDLLIQKQNLVDQKQGKDKAISVGIDNQIKEIDEKISNSVIKQAERERTAKIKTTVKEAIDKGDLKGATKEMTSEEILNIEGVSEQAAKEHGLIAINPDGSFNIILNKDKKMVATEAHEFGHAVLYKTIGSDQNVQDKLGDALIEYIADVEGDKSMLGERLSAYGKVVNGEFIRDDNFGEEVMTIMSESIIDGSLKFEESLFTKIGDGIRRFFQKIAPNTSLGRIKLNTGKDVFNFVKDYSKNITEGKVNKAILNVAKEGAKGKLVEGKATPEATVQMSKEASDKVQSIYKEQGVAGAMDIIEQFKPIVSRIAEKRREAPNFDRELLMSEIEIGERGIFDLISKYDPDSGVPLAAYINKFLPSRAIEASRRVLGEEFTEDVSERVDIAAEEVAEVEVKAKPKKKKIILSDRLGVKSKVDKAIKAKLPELDIENLNFKTLKDQAPEITGEMFGISPKKLISGANITKKELQSAQMFINKNADVLISMLPEGATASGTATGVPQTLLKAFYTKTDRAKMAKTGTKAGLAIQVKNDIKKTDFLETFGIIDGKPDRTDRNTSARVLALANQTGKMMTNQAVRQELVNQGQPLQALGHIADGKATVMFSKSKQAIGAIDRSLSPSARVLFWDDISAFTNEDILDRSLESIKIGLLNTYENIPEITGKIDELATALHKVIKNLKDPVVKNPIKLTEKLLETNNKQLSKVKEFFNSVMTAADAFRQPQRVKNFRATTSVLANKIFNPNSLEKSIAKILMMRGHLASSSRNSYLDRKQPYPGNPEFLKGTLGSIPGIEYKTKLTKDGKTQLVGVTYKGKNISLKKITSSQTSKAALNDAKDTSKLKERGKNEDLAIELLDEITDFYTELYSNSEIDNVDLQMVSASLLSNMDAVLARAAKLKYISDNAYNFENPGKEVKYEHMQPRVAVLLNLWDAKINGDGITDIKDFLKNYTIQVIPNTMDKVITESKLGESLYVGQTLDMPSWIRTYNESTKENDKGRLRPLVDVYTKKVLKPSEAIVKGLRILKPDIKKNKTLNKAIAFSRSANNETKGITVLDFDDTLATSKSLVISTSPEGAVRKLTAEEFAQEGADLLDQGWTHDFSEFSKVVDGKVASLFNKAMKLQGKFGPENMFVLTARPADSAPAIFEFLKANGLNIPLKNITGLANSTPESKALWIADKVGEGYNDFYFADDALQNVQAVKNMLDQFDVKSKVQQAKIKFSKDASGTFNDIIQETTGIESQKVFSEAQAKIRGAKSKYKSIIPPSAQDFGGLLYNFLGKGKKGEQDMAFFKKALIDPFARGINELNAARQASANDYENLLKQFPEVKKLLNKKIEGTDYTHDQAVRIYLWNKAGFEVPGLSKRDLNSVVDFVENNFKVQAFANTIGLISKKEDGYSAPGDYWLAENIKSDLLSDGSIGDARAEFLGEWQQNTDLIFSPENLNKIEAIYGSSFREALEDILYRMKTGRNRPTGGGRLMNIYTNWVNNSVGAIMFFNMRSALLQTISATNYINWSDNNPLKAATAFANQKQYWSDFSYLFNSDYLKQRRSGNQRGINEAELSAAVAGAENKAKAAIAWLLKKGFLPTQIADSFAIASGGATFYRNRVKAYIKQGMSKVDAEQKAFLDFQETTEVAQQSARPDMISQQQASPLGKLILAFQNTPMQYARIMNKAARDIYNGRGDMKTHTSKIIYYGFVQSVIFGALQSALFASLDDEDEEKFDKKKERILNGMIDSVLSGIGYGGKAVSTMKNTLTTFLDQRKRGFNADHTYTILQLLGFSPPIGSKLRKVYSSIQTDKFNKDVFKRRGLTLDNPIWSAVGNVVEGVTNVPLGRLSQKMLNIDNALDANNKWWQRTALVLGWNTWDLGVKDADIEDIKKEIKKEKKVEAKEKTKLKREEKKKEKKEANKTVIEENKKKSKKDGLCSAVSRSGKRCKNKAINGGMCTIHEEVEQSKSGKKTQCKKYKKNGDRCNMQTSNKSGFCYYHD